MKLLTVGADDIKHTQTHAKLKKPIQSLLNLPLKKQMNDERALVALSLDSIEDIDENAWAKTLTTQVNFISMKIQRHILYTFSFLGVQLN